MDHRPVSPFSATSTSRPSELFVTVDDAAILLGVTQDRVSALIKQGAIPHRGGPRDPMVPLSALQAVGIPDSTPALNGTLAPSDKIAASEPGFRKLLTDEQVTEMIGSSGPDCVVSGNALDVAREMSPECVQSVVTSPPFWGQRVYEDETSTIWRDGSEVAFGRETTPEAYIQHTLEILGALARVLKPRGTIWWNIGDTYMTRTIMRSSSKDRIEHYGGKRTKWADNPDRRVSSGHHNLKDKDLTLVPFHVASGAQQLGLWVRAVVIWSKERAADDWSDRDPDESDRARSTDTPSRAHMPEIVADRPVTGHEYILLLTKESRYEYYPQGFGPSNGATKVNVRSVWTFPPVGGKGDHGARFPDELARRCVLLGSKSGDLIFDPFAGQGTTLRVARDLGRRFIGCDVSPKYVEVAKAELRRHSPGVPDFWARRAAGPATTHSK